MFTFTRIVFLCISSDIVAIENITCQWYSSFRRLIVTLAISHTVDTVAHCCVASYNMEGIDCILDTSIVSMANILRVILV